MADERHEASPDLSPDSAIYEITLNVLGYKGQDEGEWTAIALEMDLRGFGATFKVAVQNLLELVRMQVSFAHLKGQPEMVLRPAEPVWWERFAEVRRDRLDAVIRDRSRSDSSFRSVAALPAVFPDFKTRVVLPERLDYLAVLFWLRHRYPDSDLGATLRPA